MGISGDQVSNLSAIVNTSEELAAALGDVVKQITATRVAAPPAERPLGARALAEQESNGALDAVKSIASAVVSNALGATPLIRGILNLFGGDDAEPAPQGFTKFRLPPSIAFLAAETSEGFSATRFDQGGLLQAVDRERNVSAPGSSIAPPTAGHQITVNVQAMDARSFLDRSDDIAAAVRTAMLNLNSINDVVSEL